MSLVWLRGTGGDLVANDDTFFPVVITTWCGASSDGLVRQYFAWLHEALARARRERVPLVVVTDTALAGVPSASTRRLIADLTRDWEKAGAREAGTISYVIIENALMRGVISTLNWLHGDMQTINVASCEEALTRALADLVRLKVPAPKGLVPARYRRPEPG